MSEKKDEVRRRALKQDYCQISYGTVIDVQPHMYEKYVKAGLIDPDPGDEDVAPLDDDRAEFDGLKKKDLQELLRGRGLPVSGSVQQLIDRLRASDNKEEE